jgi:hypothetical protein
MRLLEASSESAKCRFVLSALLDRKMLLGTNDFRSAVYGGTKEDQKRE